MHTFTPRTCLWPLTGTLILTFGLSFGLTFVSNHACYAGVCGEWLFPLQARLHVVVWYCWLVLSIVALGLRASQHNVSQFLQTSISSHKVPLLGKEVHTAGALVVLWITVLYAIVTGIWWQKLDSYFETRGQAEGVLHGNHLLAAIALTGHYGDITMGMALLPVSRHSALASFFKLSVSSTLTFHMLTAYTLFAIIAIHGLLYVAWLATQSTISLGVLQSYPILEPTYHIDEVYPGSTSSLGIWRASLIFTGLASTLIILVLLITAAPKIRQRHFNLFYFTHLSGILAVIIVCLHASTMFYCTAPGLSMIVIDWAMRLYELRQTLQAKVSHLGKGWYLLSVGLPRQRLKGCSCKSPLAHFYIRHGTSSIRELHPFTTTTHLASQQNVTSSQHTHLPIQFLFRKSRRIDKTDRLGSISTFGEPAAQIHPLRRFTQLLSCLPLRNRKTQPKIQWTEKLANVADTAERTNFNKAVDGGESCVSDAMDNADTSIRFEGPYFTPAIPQQYDAVICIVAGTGVSGALAIAAAFAAQNDDTDGLGDDLSMSTLMETQTTQEQLTEPATMPSSESMTQKSWRRLSIWWSVRAEDHIELPFDSLRPRPGLQVESYLTGSGRPRMDTVAKIRELRSTMPDPNSRVWAYISGPNGFISAAEAACKQEGVDHYGARWDI